jgi:hypothetical protein
MLIRADSFGCSVAKVWGLYSGPGILDPGIVGADAPKVGFEVAAGEGSAAVVHVSDVEDHLGAGGFGGGVDGVGVVHDDVDAFGLAEADLVGLGHELAELTTVIDGAEHDHAVAEGELGVHDGGVVGAEVDGLLLETEGAGEPVDGGQGVAVTKAGDDGGAAGFGLSVHGASVSLGLGWRLGKNGVGYPLLPACKPPVFISLHEATACKIFIINESLPKYSI